MANTIGIRREDKHQWEARVPLTPKAVAELTGQHRVEVVIQPSTIRAFPDATYKQAGAAVQEDLSAADLVFAVKEVPKDLLRKDGAYMFFSHTIKGQSYNMPLLQRMLDLGCTLFDYERIVDAQGRRLVFFGRHAGLAGMIDTLAVLGRRLTALGQDTPFANIKLAHEYPSLNDAQDTLRALAPSLRGIAEELQPFVVGFAGYGNVSRGAQEIYDLLEPQTITPSALLELPKDAKGLYKVVFAEEHLVAPKAEGAPFVKQEYFDHPDRFRSTFEQYAPSLSVLINAIYWTADYPRLLDNAQLARLINGEEKLKVIGDISCDIEGSVECTVKATTPGQPSYVYRPNDGSVVDGHEGEGLCMMTTDCLPCELPRESSSSFTKALSPFIPALSQADLTVPFEQAKLPAPIRASAIVWRGALTPDYAYLSEHLKNAGD